MGTPGAGPRRVAQARDRAPLQTWQALRVTTTGRHWVTPEDKHRAAEQSAAEIAKRRADFNATNN